LSIDYLFCGISLAVAVLSNPIRVLRQLWPHLTMMALFVGFVVWNGGVVLGDKSNHIATLHLAQMLYIWPMFAFFSAPLLLPQVLGIAWGVLRIAVRRSRASRMPQQSTSITTSPDGTRAISEIATSSKSRAETDTGKKQRDKGASTLAQTPLQKTVALRAFEFVMQNHISKPLWSALTLIASYLIVKHNTLIHPFTLADNRHYMFYIFRYTVLRSETVRWLLIIPYTLSRFFIWSCLEGCPMSVSGGLGPDCPGNMAGVGGEHISIPGRISEPLQARQRSDQARSQQSKVSASATVTATTFDSSSLLDSPSSSSALAPPTSTVLLWLLATTLSLISAPLVEPRYFILPWVFWRLLVPAWPAHECFPSPRNEANLAHIQGLPWVYRVGKKLDVRLVLETLWFVATNLDTMYIFIAKPFFWRSPDGTLLDDGKVQRFMW
jgi:alpha-1,2-glucosyltransferase